eukprot:5020674-Pyramimonas_sp.AAC.1
MDGARKGSDGLGSSRILFNMDGAPLGSDSKRMELSYEPIGEGWRSNKILLGAEGSNRIPLGMGGARLGPY